jgi:LPXTG-motif cell wall-anchored protein
MSGILIMNFFLVIIPSLNVDAAPLQVIPQVGLELEEDNKTAYVGPNDSGLVVFHGRLRVNYYFRGDTSLDITLTVEDTWNSAKVVPWFFHMTNSGNPTFKVTFKAPQYTSCDVIGRFRVSGEWVMSPSTLSGECEPVEGSVHIAQYHLFSLKSKESTPEVNLGEREKCCLLIENHGNGEASFSVRIKNFDELDDKGLRFLVPLCYPQAPSGAECEYEIIVEVPDDWDLEGEHDIKLEVVAREQNSMTRSDDQNVEEYTFKLKINAGNVLASKTGFSVSIFILIMILLIITIIVWRRRKRKKYVQ